MIVAMMSDVESQVIRWLATGGGAAVGAVLVTVVVKVAGRFTRNKRVPWLVLNSSRLLGAVAAGLVVYFLFNPEGGSFGFGGGDSLFGGKGEGANTGSSIPRDTRPHSLTSNPAIEGAPVLRIIMRGGSGVQEKRYYQLDGDPKPRSLDDIQELIDRRRQQGPPLTGVEIVLRADSVARETSPVTSLMDLARARDLKVTITGP